MSKRVTVIVEGREYIVEVGNLDEAPIKATVNQKTYEVDLPLPSDIADTHPTTTPEPDQPGDVPPQKSEAADDRSITAPLPGDILEIRVKAGDRVNPGDVICVLEAMKMKNLIHSNVSGVVDSVHVVVGQRVDYGAILVTFS